jgi:polyisoprenoid-binding protein YceI
MADVQEAEAITRKVDGVELPLAGTYALDVSHTQVGFAVRHMAVSKVRGRFDKFDGAIQIAEDPTQSSVNVTIDATSVDTQDETRNNHLRTNDFFDVENHPTWTFVTTSVVPDGKGAWKVNGDLTIRGITRPVTLETTLEGVVKDPYGNVRVGFSASAEIDREDFDVSFGAVMDAGGLVVAKKVTIEIEAEAVLQA